MILTSCKHGLWMRILYSFVLIVTLLASCSKKDASLAERAKSQTLHLSLAGEPPTLDPRKATDTISLAVIKMCFEGLLDFDESGQIIPALAERIEISEDRLTYTFHLRAASWSDGAPITALDVEHTWKAIIDPAFPCPFSSDLYVLKNGHAAKMGKCPVDQLGVNAINERTLRVELDHPTPYFLQLVASHSFPVVPSHIAIPFPGWAENFSPQFVCNGPFCLSRWKHNAEIDLIKNEHYWNAEKIRLQHISIPIIEDEMTTLNLFENGDLDWAGSPLSSLPLDAMEHLKNRKEIHIHPIPGVYFYLFNTKQFPFTNAHIRRALSFAINREEIVSNVLQTGQPSATALIPPGMWNRSSGLFHDADLEAARRELEIGLQELNITKEQLPVFNLSYNTNSGHHKIAQAIQGQWRSALGIQVVLNNMEWKVFLDQLRHYQFSIARMGGLAGFNDPMTFFELYKYPSSSDNYTQWNHPRFTELLCASDLATTPQERTHILSQAEQILIEEMPLIPIYFYTAAYLKSKALKGVRIDALGQADFKFAYLEGP